MNKAVEHGLRGARRTSIDVDVDTAAALAYLRSCESASASRLLRDAAHSALAAQGRQAVHGVILPVKAT